ncbi:MAG: 50S ribosomal protein L18 [Planctomycetota bacterium]
MKDRHFRKFRQRIKRAHRVRRGLRGTTERPRLTVFRSLKHIYAQIVDDSVGNTLCAASTQDKAIREALAGKSGNKAAAEKVGAEIAKRAIEKGLKKVAFDRGPYKYHGRVKALADAARKAGLSF